MTQYLHTDHVSVAYLITVSIFPLTMLTDCANPAVLSTSTAAALFSWKDLRMYGSVFFEWVRRAMTAELALGSTVLLAHLRITLRVLCGLWLIFDR